MNFSTEWSWSEMWTFNTPMSVVMQLRFQTSFPSMFWITAIIFWSFVVIVWFFISSSTRPLRVSRSRFTSAVILFGIFLLRVSSSLDVTSVPSRMNVCIFFVSGM
ncbi:hypothetical protein CMI46_02415 [Candidatus Pacearchaeota archaeon]|nr:hypothetical protein [Candidatus Pacearchaeota archaeon]